MKCSRVSWIWVLDSKRVVIYKSSWTFRRRALLEKSGPSQGFLTGLMSSSIFTSWDCIKSLCCRPLFLVPCFLQLLPGPLHHCALPQDWRIIKIDLHLSYVNSAPFKVSILNKRTVFSPHIFLNPLWQQGLHFRRWEFSVSLYNPTGVHSHTTGSAHTKGPVYRIVIFYYLLYWNVFIALSFYVI